MNTKFDLLKQSVTWSQIKSPLWFMSLQISFIESELYYWSQNNKSTYIEIHLSAFLLNWIQFLFSFGVCCIFLYDSSSDTQISYNDTYIQNPGFPSTYGETNSLSYTVNKCSDGNFCLLPYSNFRFILFCICAIVVKLFHSLVHNVHTDQIWP